MLHRIPVRRREVLRDRLDRLVGTCDLSVLAPDPLEIPHRYGDPRDQEVAAQIAAAFAYGRADIAVANVSGVLGAMGPSPHAYLASEFEPREARERFRGFAHRFHKTPDLVALLSCLGAALRTHGSLGELFENCYDGDAPDIAPSLTRYVDLLIEGGSLTRTRVTAPPPKSLAYLLTSPRDGSACKRMNLFLRWMVRREAPDLGLWTFVDPAKLVMPLDTHVHRIATFLGLTRRRTANWKTARELTDTLAIFDARDPVRYDFAICRLGILDQCSRKRRKAQCDVCTLRDVCRFPVTR